ncbi:MAG: helix-turn-helix domain-containing protein, partial [Verrucomicrobiota bacterium]|nr:helix-turn-helix domain-containing protein [Verrucomicrobiota bacterium]MDX2108805.1 helix-turn-helix domain-containing protein [Verrucomicrobiota bacterium]
MDRRYQFALEAIQPGVNMTELCRQYGISKPTGYKWK